MSPFPAEPPNTASSGGVSGSWFAPVQPAPKPEAGGEVALTRLVNRWLVNNQSTDEGLWPDELAKAVLASDWLADRLAEAVKAERASWEKSVLEYVTQHAVVRDDLTASDAIPDWLGVIASALLDARAARTAPLQDAEEDGE